MVIFKKFMSDYFYEQFCYAYVTKPITDEDMLNVCNNITNDLNKLFNSDKYKVIEDYSCESGFELTYFPTKKENMYKAIRFCDFDAKKEIRTCDNIIKKIYFCAICRHYAPKWTEDEYKIFFNNMRKIGILCIRTHNK